MALSNDNITLEGGFWSSDNESKAATVISLLDGKEYLTLYNLMRSDRSIDSSVTGAPRGFEKFTVLFDELKLQVEKLIPLLLHITSGADEFSLWKKDAKDYLLGFCRNNFELCVSYAAEVGAANMWRALTEAYPEKTTDIMLDLLLVKNAGNKNVLREVLSETKFDIFPILSEEYLCAPFAEKIGIVRLLLMFKKYPEAKRLQEKIKSTEKSQTILNLLSRRGNGLNFKTKVSVSPEGDIIARKGDKACVFRYNSGKITVSGTGENINLAKLAVKQREKFIEDMFLSGECITMNELSRAINEDILFSHICENKLFTVYGDMRTPVKLFTVVLGKITSVDGEIDLDSDEIVAPSHPSEFAESSLKYDAKAFPEQMERDSFLPTKAESRLSSISAFTGSMVGEKQGIRLAKQKGLKVVLGNEVSYFTAKWGNYFCVYTFTSHKNNLSLGSGYFYDSAVLPVSGSKVIFRNAVPLTIGSVPPRIFSEFLSRIYYCQRG